MMRTLKHSTSGLTLVELTVSILISTMLFLIVGAIMVYSKEAWEKAVQRTALEQDFRYCLRKLEFEMRGASTEPSRSTLLHTSASGALTTFFHIDGANSDEVTFQNVDYKVGKYVLNRVRRESDKLRYESWYFTTSASAIPQTLVFPSVSNPPDESLIILENVKNVTMSYDTHAPSGHDAVRMRLATERSPAFSSAIILRSTHTFTIRTRMKVAQ